ncbi:chemotaxis protein CheW [Anaerobiospirillum sp. NML02-A-032]|uniref:chemotaxis protein CheW n=1 Tax=Anaerobiospirillum sp. NML02-A-032 TaxID=2932818 RepID=UPI001FF15719|nr:chemotaxis protein CheW [Anaerobiospirillum sp. NML02-A-032]MCK0540413.1 chemotaxis protein CheW [Anaerobiospirillum sp. NML02-A-032]
MSASHHDREEETLIAYFQQMLADVDDQEFDGEIQSEAGDLAAVPAQESAYSAESNRQVLQSANAAIHSGHSAAAEETPEPEAPLTAAEQHTMDAMGAIDPELAPPPADPVLGGPVSLTAMAERAAAARAAAEAAAAAAAAAEAARSASEAAEAAQAVTEAEDAPSAAAAAAVATSVHSALVARAESELAAVQSEMAREAAMREAQGMSPEEALREGLQMHKDPVPMPDSAPQPAVTHQNIQAQSTLSASSSDSINQDTAAAAAEAAAEYAAAAATLASASSAESAAAAAQAALAASAGSSAVPEPQPQPVTHTRTEESTLEYATPADSDSLQRLLATVEVDTDAETAVKTEQPEVKVEVAPAEPEVKVEVAPAEPEVKVEVAPAEPEVKVEVAPAEPEVKVEAAPAEPEVKVEAAPAEPEVKVEAAPAEPEVKVEVAPAPVAPAPAVEVAAPVAAPAPVIAAAKKQEAEVVKTPQQLAQERMAKKLEAIAAEWKNVDLGEQFQVLFFLVQGVRFAVPLIDLGGIFECDKITQLFGKPSWFMGITDVRGDKINIVDTLRWVMPEINDSPDKYPYLISLGNTEWSIGCDVLEGNRTLTSSQIKWREIPGNRPWLAGIVTSDKCAVLHVQSLIALFEAGADIEDLYKNLKSKEETESNKSDKNATAPAAR